MSIDAVSSQPPHFAKPQSSGSAKEAPEAGETSAQESTEGSASAKAPAPSGAAQVFDIQA